MENALLRTPRLALHPTGPAVFDGLWAAIEESLEELAPWMTWAVDPTPEHVRDFLERAQEGWQSGGNRSFTIMVDGEPSGQCGLDRLDSLVGSCEIGYWLRSDLCGRGLMTEAASAAIGFAFEELGIHRIELHAGTNNGASNRIAQKLGFRREGLLRERGLGAGGRYDMHVYGLLATDARPSFS